MRNDNKKSCPRCNHYGPIEQDFGYRIMNRRHVRPQSWCRACRSRAKHLLVSLPPKQTISR
ncbi:hypothetical protein F0U60_09045 [Archangium minus]|uniref:Uncharacterized protein n=1 Tax=Archangium minus TaxID=83450 RepID=A0ABY9WK68_9BACT|nr:hypothetical protein F0U60_09045 [Archangium minus]